MHTHTLHRTPKEGEIQQQSKSWVHDHFEKLLAETGVVLNGARAGDPQIRNERVFRRIALRGTLGAGEAYVDGDWDCANLDELSAHLLRSGADRQWEAARILLPRQILAYLINLQDKSRARRNVEAHYDLGNDLYERMLGPTMAYSCGYWREAKTLDEAQNAKHELVCRKLAVRSGMRVLDIGCGWGGFAKYAAEHYEVNVVGVTLSVPQADYARRLCAHLPVDIQVCDYRDVRDKFDRIVSIGMFEHVGPRNYRKYFKAVRSHLVPEGLFLLQTIGSLRSVQRLDRWMARHIFPNAVLPSASQIERAAEDLFVLEDWHNFGADYDKTLMAWHANFKAAWPDLREKYGERFRRKWRYYLLTCAGAFRARRNQLWQIVFSNCGVPGGYIRPVC
jgi:cyclopropane-fatty-acyl-phospholipid synthase